jgi:hypothetical protein
MSLLSGSWKSFIVCATAVPTFGCLSDASRGHAVLGYLTTARLYSLLCWYWRVVCGSRVAWAGIWSIDESSLMRASYICTLKHCHRRLVERCFGWLVYILAVMAIATCNSLMYTKLAGSYLLCRYGLGLLTYIDIVVASCLYRYTPFSAVPLASVHCYSLC